MSKHIQVFQLVKEAYESSKEPFAQWVWQNHVPIVANKTEELAQKFHADLDISVAGAWIHDFGDVFVHRFSNEHEDISREKSTEVLKKSGYSTLEIEKVFEEVIAPHSCKNDFLPITIEGKVVATADALAHLTTDFYLQFAWKNLPERKNYEEYIEWVIEKLERDFRIKIFFNEVRDEVRHRYEALREVLQTFL